MDDRTLLERAAKAMGYTLKWGEVHMIGDDEIDCTDQPYVVSGQPDEADWYWDPLNDDGDALRLAVVCGLSVTPYPIYSQPKHSVIAKRYEGGPAVYRGDAKPIEAMEVYGSDPYAATRRAIVRAAAEIGGE